MKVFRFSLGRILDFRRNEEQQRAQSLASARRQSDSAQRARQDLVEIQQAGRAKLADAHRTGGSIGILRNMEFVLERMEEHVQDADQVCQRADEDLVESVKHHAEAVRERHSLDCLRDRRMQEWRIEEGRREQKEIDEVAITRHGRRVLDSPGTSGRP
jgi:flagellar export protein FliJ